MNDGAGRFADAMGDQTRTYDTLVVGDVNGDGLDDGAWLSGTSVHVGIAAPR